MDEAVIRYYRQLMRQGFKHFGLIDNASIFVDTHGDRFSICGLSGGFMEIYVAVLDDVISDMKYRCSCEPAANVAIEAMCILLRGKPLATAMEFSESTICEFIGTNAEDLRKKAKGLLDLLNGGILRYQKTIHHQESGSGEQ